MSRANRYSLFTGVAAFLAGACIMPVFAVDYANLLGSYPAFPFFVTGAVALFFCIATAFACRRAWYVPMIFAIVVAVMAVAQRAMIIVSIEDLPTYCEGPLIVSGLIVTVFGLVAACLAPVVAKRAAIIGDKFVINPYYAAAVLLCLLAYVICTTANTSSYFSYPVYDNYGGVTYYSILEQDYHVVYCYAMAGTALLLFVIADIVVAAFTKNRIATSIIETASIVGSAIALTVLFIEASLINDASAAFIPFIWILAASYCVVRFVPVFDMPVRRLEGADMPPQSYVKTAAPPAYMRPPRAPFGPPAGYQYPPQPPVYPYGQPQYYAPQQPYVQPMPQQPYAQPMQQQVPQQPTYTSQAGNMYQPQWQPQPAPQYAPQPPVQHQAPQPAPQAQPMPQPVQQPAPQQPAQPQGSDKQPDAAPRMSAEEKAKLTPAKRLDVENLERMYDAGQISLAQYKAEIAAIIGTK